MWKTGLPPLLHAGCDHVPLFAASAFVCDLRRNILTTAAVRREQSGADRNEPEVALTTHEERSALSSSLFSSPVTTMVRSSGIMSRSFTLPPP